jgi:hypothetical protein
LQQELEKAKRESEKPEMKLRQRDEEISRLKDLVQNTLLKYEEEGEAGVRRMDSMGAKILQVFIMPPPFPAFSSFLIVILFIIHLTQNFLSWKKS